MIDLSMVARTAQVVEHVLFRCDANRAQVDVGTDAVLGARDGVVRGARTFAHCAARAVVYKLAHSELYSGYA